MRAYVLLGLTLSVSSGCSSTYEVRDFAKVNEKAVDNTVTISTKEGEEMRAKDLSVRDDSTTFLEVTTEKRITITTLSVGTFAMNNVGAGAIDGLFGGAIVGAPMGALW
jgi:UDP-N-acetylmuramyl pentapeptide synthase